MILFLESIGTGEIILIFFFILIFFGADSIPGLARGLGKGIRQLKDATQDVQDEILKSTTEMRRDMNVNKALNEAKETIKNPIERFTRDLQNQTEEISDTIEKTGKEAIDNIEKDIPKGPLDQMGME